MRIHCFQHVPFEGMGVISSWCLQHNFKIQYTQFYKDYEFPNIEDIDLLIIMGGSMGVYDESQYSWLKQEKLFIKSAIDNGKKIMGICLGAQLIASVLGANVYKNNEKEIGWFPLQYSKEAVSLGFSGSLNEDNFVFHWHGDAFELPPNAISIGSSKATACQGFIYDDRVVGLQYHLEVDNNYILDLVEHGRGELTEGKYIQSKNDITNTLSYYEYCHSLMFKILTYLMT